MYNIALVEDEKDLNDLIKTYLEKEGYNVTSYYNGDTAIKDCNKDYHLWILDIMLGDDISGYDIIKKLERIIMMFRLSLLLLEIRIWIR